MSTDASNTSGFPAPTDRRRTPGPDRGGRAAPARVAFRDSDIELDAAIVADGLGLRPAEIPALMRAGAITSLSESGVGEDAGRHRLTFFHKGRRFRLVVDAAGRVIQRGVVDFGERPLPASIRKPGN